MMAGADELAKRLIRRQWKVVAEFTECLYREQGLVGRPVEHAQIQIIEQPGSITLCIACRIARSYKVSNRQLV